MKGKRVKKKGQMSRRLVVFCVAVLTAAAIWSAALKSIRPEADLTDVLTFVGGAFGGELLMLLAKRVFAKDKEDMQDE